MSPHVRKSRMFWLRCFRSSRRLAEATFSLSYDKLGEIESRILGREQQTILGSASSSV